MSSDGYGYRGLGPPSNSDISQPESESGSNQPYSLLPPRISRIEYNAIAQLSSAEGGDPSAHEDPYNEAVSSSSQSIRGRRPKYPAGNPLEIFLKGAEEEGRIREWLDNEAGEAEKQAYEEDLRQREEERKIKEDLEKERRREYDRQRYLKKKEEQRRGG